MFLNKEYVLANELVQKMGINIANISMLKKQFEDNDDRYSIQSLNNCSFINKKATLLPKYIKDGLDSHEFTDMSDKLPCTWVKEEYQITEKELKQSNLVISKEKISGKQFYVFSPDFVKTMKNKIGYVLDEKETMKCYQLKQIEGYIKLKNNKYFTWY